LSDESKFGLKEHVDLRSPGYEQDACQAWIRVLRAFFEEIWRVQANIGCQVLVLSEHHGLGPGADGIKKAAQSCGLDGFEMRR
jgi:hypothetical protein